MTAVTLATLLVLSVSVSAQEDVLRPKGRKKPQGDTAETKDLQVRDKASAKKFRIGAELGINYNLASRLVEGTLPTSPYMVLESGSGVSPFAGLYVEMIVRPSVSIGLRMFYDVKYFGDEKTDVIEDCPIVEPISGYVIGYKLSSLNATYTTSVKYLTFNPLVRFVSPIGLFVHVGPSIQFSLGNISTSLVERMDVTEDCRFEIRSVLSNERVTTESIQPSPSLRIGLDVGVGYTIPLSSGFELVPRIGYQLPITAYGESQNETDDTSQYSNGIAPFTLSAGSLQSFQASLSVWFVL